MNKNLLETIMKKRGISLSALSKKTGILRLILIIKIAGLAEFSAGEIVKISKALFLTDEEMRKIFFEEKVS